VLVLPDGSTHMNGSDGQQAHILMWSRSLLFTHFIFCYFDIYLFLFLCYFDIFIFQNYLFVKIWLNTIAIFYINTEYQLNLSLILQLKQNVSLFIKLIYFNIFLLMIFKLDDKFLKFYWYQFFKIHIKILIVNLSETILTALTIIFSCRVYIYFEFKVVVKRPINSCKFLWHISKSRINI
jgi:hypothetical protein